MPAIILNSEEILDFENLPKNVLSPGPALSANSGGFVQMHYQKALTIAMRNEIFPHMNVTDLRWSTGEQVELHVNTPGDTVNINFHMGGQLDTTFSDISHPLHMRPLTHNVVFSPESRNLNRMAKNSRIEMLHVSLDKQFFSSIIGFEDAWSEHMQNNLLFNRSFAGVEGTLAITPRMIHLANEIRTGGGRGPLRNLLVQSRVLELLACQIEQLRAPAPCHEEIRADEAEKLYVLKNYIDIHFLSDLSLAQLSRICLLNEFKVKKGFKLLFKTTVFGYVRQKRMEHAALLLRDGGKTVEEVSAELGYEHAHHFSIAFKKFTGTSPSHFQGKKELLAEVA